MLKSSVLKVICAVALATAGLGTLAGCTSKNTGGVAATVNGVEIPEDKVTKAIESLRKQQSVTSKDSWGRWMAEYDYTPEALRDSYLDTYVDQEVLRQAAKEMGINVEQSEIDTYINDMRSRYESDEAWKEALDSVGLTEDDYRENIEFALYKKGVEDNLKGPDFVETDPLQYAKDHLSEVNGVKKSSHILFETGQDAQAQEVLNKINSGEITFEDAVTQYSTDTGSASDGGNVGWNAPIGSFIDEYANALKGLSKGQVSGLVPSQFGIHIIKVTDVFTAPASINALEDLPEDISNYFTNQTDNLNDISSKYSEWLEEKKASFTIVRNEMPKNVPYNVDMSKYETKSEEDEANANAAVEQEVATEQTAEDVAAMEAEAATGEQQPAQGQPAQ